MHSSLKPMMHMEIELDPIQKQIQAFEPIDWKTATREELVEFMKQTGIIGQGGAGFPTYVKYLNPEGIDTVVINGIECEPYITANYKTVFDQTQDLLDGCLIMKKMANADKVIIGLKQNREDLAKYLRDEIAREKIEGIEVRTVPNVYPMGMERVLIYSLLKRRYDRLPAECGVIVNNTQTAIYTARAMEKGEAIANKYVTVSGEALNFPNNVIVPVGMVVSEIIEKIGGLNDDLANCRLIAGGPMMGTSMVNDQFVIDRAMNAITALPIKDYEPTTCMHCGRCSAHCPVTLQPIRISLALQSGDSALMEKRGALRCVECGLCTYVCPAKIQLTEDVKRAKRAIMMKKK